MKPRYLGKQIWPHRLAVAFDEEKIVDCPICLVSPGLTTAANLLPPLPPLPPATGRKALMLVSADAGLGVRLDSLADRAGLALLQINDSANALQLAAQHHPAVVCLDLDLPELAVWEAAERLLQDDAGPVLVLLSGRTDHFDLGAAIRAGAIVDKSASSAQLFERVDGMLAEPEAQRADRKTRQRRLVRWLRPYDWAAPVEPTQRHWGINE
jgi:CheY-like chemotaxis protein